jgi:hypothetical protein
MKTVLICVDYEEFKPETYKGVYLFDEGKELFRSSLGNFDKDYQVCLEEGKKIVVKTGQVLVCSSSVDDWFMNQPDEEVL